MKKYLPALAAAVAFLIVGATLRAPRNASAYDFIGFGQLPTLVNGRVKPLDTVARTTLLVLQGRQRVTTTDGRTLTPSEWLLDVLFHPGLANSYPTFEIVHPDVLALFRLTTEQGAGGKRFSASQLSPGLAELDRQAKLADDTESALRTTFQRAVVQLRDNLVLYQRLGQSLVPAGVDDYFEQFTRFQQVLPAGVATARAHGAGPPADAAAAKLTLEMSR